MGLNLYWLALPLAGLVAGVLLHRFTAYASFVEMNGEAFRRFFDVVFFIPHEDHRHRGSYPSR